ncbi:uncharacterized protein LOC131928521 [Physella acuta]|uniref:uncharacterized protein LOC131928521 n=1 Tax=Physella acuta TaxID=109671 RepID=UPI0027DB9EEA|nr:uncharacterized protein LOC131928521 [Physella acuta]
MALSRQESEIHSVEANVAIPTISLNQLRECGADKKVYDLKIEILQDANISESEFDLYALQLCGKDGSTQTLDDNKLVSNYAADLADQSEIQLIRLKIDENTN